MGAPTKFTDVAVKGNYFDKQGNKSLHAIEFDSSQFRGQTASSPADVGNLPAGAKIVSIVAYVRTAGSAVVDIGTSADNDGIVSNWTATTGVTEAVPLLPLAEDVGTSDTILTANVNSASNSFAATFVVTYYA